MPDVGQGEKIKEKYGIGVRYCEHESRAKRQSEARCAASLINTAYMERLRSELGDRLGLCCSHGNPDISGQLPRSVQGQHRLGANRFRVPDAARVTAAVAAVQ